MKEVIPPVQPKLRYYKNEELINNLIDARMNPNNKVKNDVCSITYNKTSGIKSNEAIKIDSVLKNLKVAGDASMKSLADKEEGLILKYTIEY